MVTILKFYAGWGLVKAVSERLYDEVKDITDPCPVGDDFNCVKYYGRMRHRNRNRDLYGQIRAEEDYWRRFEEKHGKLTTEECKKLAREAEANNSPEFQDDGEVWRRYEFSLPDTPIDLLFLGKDALVKGKDAFVNYITSIDM